MESFRKSGRRARAYVSATVIAALFATNAAAVTLSNVEGAVSVNRGDGFVPASSGTTLSAGDRVRVGANGAASIVYENGCATKVASSQITVVLTAPPSCQGARLKDGGLVVGAGVGIGDGLKDGPVVAGIGTDTLIIGGLVVAAGVGIAVAATSDNGSSYSTASNSGGGGSGGGGGTGGGGGGGGNPVSP